MQCTVFALMPSGDGHAFVAAVRSNHGKRRAVADNGQTTLAVSPIVADLFGNESFAGGAVPVAFVDLSNHTIRPFQMA